MARIDDEVGCNAATEIGIGVLVVVEDTPRVDAQAFQEGGDNSRLPAAAEQNESSNHGKGDATLPENGYSHLATTTPASVSVAAAEERQQSDGPNNCGKGDDDKCSDKEPSGCPDEQPRTRGMDSSLPPPPPQSSPPLADSARPGAVYVRTRAAGRMPAWGRRVVERAFAVSSRFGASYLFSSRSRRSRHRGRNSSIIPVVMTAELAPGESVREAPLMDMTMAHCRRQHNGSLVLEGVPVPSCDEEAKERKLFSMCLPSNRSKVCASVATVLVVAAAATAILKALLPQVPPVADDNSVSALDSNRSEIDHPLLEVVAQLSSLDDLRDKESPQHRALQWLVEDWNFSAPSLPVLPPIDNATPQLLQRYALAVLYYSTGGPTSWLEKFGFLSSEHECEWSQVRCNNKSVVVKLLLSGNNLTGMLPDVEFAAFPSLKELNMQHNALKGTIPSDIGKLKSLKSLFLGYNMLTGPIPSTIGNMTSMKALKVDLNRLSSTIPPSWNSLDQLIWFSFYGNDINGTLPVSISGNENLQWITGGDNHLTGTIPSALGALPQLTLLLLENNKLHGSIPESLSNLTQLEVLSLGSNSLTGTIPPDIFYGGTLRVLGVGDNHLNGTLPEEIGNPSDIVAVSVELNQITGTIPSKYGNLQSLLGLSLFSNLLSGTIPSSLGNNTETIALMLENNILNGTVPENLAELKKSKWISLARNDLTGNLNFLCSENASMEQIVTADCAPPGIEVICNCCICCNDASGGCKVHLDMLAYAKKCVVEKSCGNISFSGDELSISYGT